MGFAVSVGVPQELQCTTCSNPELPVSHTTRLLVGCQPRAGPRTPHQIRCFRLKQPITNDVHKTSLEVSLNVLQAYLAQLQAQPSSNPRATTEEAHIARQVSGLQWLTLGWVRICASQSTPPRVVRPCTANVTGVIQEEVVMF